VARIDLKNKVIQAKIVYYGPGLCGKTTNLEYVNKHLGSGQELMSLSTEGDRTIFFDFMPLQLGKLRGMDVQFKLYTVPGQVRYNETRKMVLKNVDGVVFVADSQELMMDANLESLESLYDNLKELGIDAGVTTIVMQYNKRDLPSALPPSALDEALNPKGYPTFLASAMTGQGVGETLRETCVLTLNRLAQALPGGDRHSTPSPAARSRRPSNGGSGSKAAAPLPKPSSPAKSPEPPPPAPAPRDRVSAAALDQAGIQAVIREELSRFRDRAGGSDQEWVTKLVTRDDWVALGQQMTRLGETLGERASREHVAGLEKRLDALAPRIAKVDQIHDAVAELRRSLERPATESGSPPVDAVTQTHIEMLDARLSSELGRLHTEIGKLAAKQAAPPPSAPLDLSKLSGEVAATEERLTRKLSALAPEPSGPGQLEAVTDIIRSELGKLEARLGELPTQSQLDALAEQLEQLPKKSDLERLSAQLASLASQATRRPTPVDGTRPAEPKTPTPSPPVEPVVSEREETAEAASVDSQVSDVPPAPKVTTQRSWPPRREGTSGPPATGEEGAEVAAGPEPAPPSEPEPSPEAAPEPEPLPPPEPTTAASTGDKSTHAEPEEPPSSRTERPSRRPTALPPPEGLPGVPHVATTATAEPETAEPADDEPVTSEPADEATVASAGSPAAAEPPPDDPAHVNASRIARVMVADLYLYNKAAVEEGIRNDDFFERNKEALTDMRATFESRVPREVRERTDHLDSAIRAFLEKKRKQLGLDS
jgi:signal recognition particle receptor subunit beta